MFIRTERLFLRPGWPEDFEELVEVLGENAVGLSIGDAMLPHTPAEVRTYLWRARDVHAPHFLINLRAPDGPRVIGSIALARAGEDVELGCWIAQEHQGRGYAAEAVRAVLAQARALGYREVLATHQAGSDESARVLQQSGFRPIKDAGTRLTGVGASKGAKLYVAVLQDKLSDLMAGARKALAPDVPVIRPANQSS